MPVTSGGGPILKRCSKYSTLLMNFQNQNKPKGRTQSKGEKELEMFTECTVDQFAVLSNNSQNKFTIFDAYCSSDAPRFLISYYG